MTATTTRHDVGLARAQLDGIYPAVAGTQTLVLGSPKFTKTVLHLPSRGSPGT